MARFVGGVAACVLFASRFMLSVAAVLVSNTAVAESRTVFHDRPLHTGTMVQKLGLNKHRLTRGLQRTSAGTATAARSLNKTQPFYLYASRPGNAIYPSLFNFQTPSDSIEEVNSTGGYVIIDKHGDAEICVEECIPTAFIYVDDGFRNFFKVASGEHKDSAVTTRRGGFVRVTTKTPTGKMFNTHNLQARPFQFQAPGVGRPFLMFRGTGITRRTVSEYAQSETGPFLLSVNADFKKRVYFVMDQHSYQTAQLQPRDSAGETLYRPPLPPLWVQEISCIQSDCPVKQCWHPILNACQPFSTFSDVP